MTRYSVAKLFLKPILEQKCHFCGATVTWTAKELKKEIKITGKHFCKHFNGNCTIAFSKWNKAGK